MKIIWLGHSAFIIYTGGKKILIDPFISGNTKFPKEMEYEVKNPDYIVITHGHSDHIGDTLSLYNSSLTKVISIFEICNWLRSKGIANCVDMNIGGAFAEKGIKFTMVQAIHSSGISDGKNVIYGGLAAGFIISCAGLSLYHMGDTDIFGDMSLIQKLYSPDIGLIPIGGKYTMTPEHAAMACNEFFSFKKIIPMHYGTFNGIDVNVMEFIGKIDNKNALCIMKPGDCIEL